MTARSALLALAALIACAPNETPITKKGYPGDPILGAPFTIAEAPDGIWSWIEFPDTACADGSTTGLGVNPGTGPDLLVFFDGGGACWSYLTCETAQTAVDHSYDAAKFAVEVQDWFPGSLMDRTALPPTLVDATLVFVPYCTADVHGGDAVQTYSGLDPLPTEVTWNHVGHANVMAYLQRLGATWPSPGKLVVSGSSAGGFGALVSYEAFRWYWPDAQGYLVDDSGPPLVAGDIPAWMRDAWYNAWHLGVSLDPICVNCRDDFSLAISQYAGSYKQDRIALLSQTQDHVMSVFLGGKTGAQFEAALGRLEAARFTPSDNARVFFDAGTEHMLLTSETPVLSGSYVASHVTGTTSLTDWLELMVSDDPAWDSVKP
jgi:hypothetical protein